MANELPNATLLMRNPNFRDWVRAGIVYQARVVITEPTTVTDHATRLELATTVALNPDQHINIFVNALACDPDICGVGSEVGEGAGLIGQNLLLTHIAAIWTALAKLLHPSVP